jgi:hypothetical protein
VAILAPADLATFAPGVSVATATAAISQAQATVEGPAGANRPLEKQVFTEILNVSSIRLQALYLTRLPIDFGSAITIEVRAGNVLQSYGRPASLGAWQTLTADQYNLDTTGQLSLNIGISGFTGSRGFYRGRSQGGISTEVRATYTTGLDFSGSSSEITALKYALGQIIVFQNSKAFKSGVSEIDLFRRVKTKFQLPEASSNSLSRTPADLLFPFKKYQPRSGF